MSNKSNARRKAARAEARQEDNLARKAALAKLGRSEQARVSFGHLTANPGKLLAIRQEQWEGRNSKGRPLTETEAAEAARLREVRVLFGTEAEEFQRNELEKVRRLNTGFIVSGAESDPELLKSMKSRHRTSALKAQISVAASGRSSSSAKSSLKNDCRPMAPKTNFKDWNLEPGDRASQEFYKVPIKMRPSSGQIA